VAERHRLLVALLLEDPVATEINGIRRALGSSQLGRIAPHVTLVPPANVAADAIAAAERVVRDAARRVAAFDAELGPPATFADNRSVLYLAVSMSNELESLRSALFAGPFAGRDASARPFIPHVTLDSGPSRHVDERMLDDLSGYVTSQRIGAVSLLEERDAASGRVWAPITNYALDNGGISGVGGLEIRLAHGHRLSPFLRALAASWDAPIPPPLATEYFVVASIGDELVGLATWLEASDAAILRSHVVAPSSRGLGVGTRLLSFVEQFERNLRRNALIVEPELRATAEAYYESRGY
jgi:2'-5' RNA ligase